MEETGKKWIAECIDDEPEERNISVPYEDAKEAVNLLANAGWKLASKKWDAGGKYRGYGKRFNRPKTIRIYHSPDGKSAVRVSYGQAPFGGYAGWLAFFKTQDEDKA